MTESRLPSVPAAFIQTEDVTFRGPRGPVFQDCTLSIEPGQRWAIVGPNGSGKALLVAGLMGKLGLLSGRLRHPFLEGDARFADSVFGVLPPGSMSFASMTEHRQWLLAREFHQFRWHGSLAQGTATVWDFLQRGQVEKRNPFVVLDPSDDELFSQVRQREIARFELEPLLRRPVVALSNGELHRFVMARALLMRPRLLFVDHPSAGLDARSRHRLRAIFEELHAEGLGLVLVTEREDELPSGITHVARVKACQILRVGSREEPAGGFAAAWALRDDDLPRPPRVALAAGTPILEMSQVSVRQGDVALLDGIDWTIAQAEHWALVGENGSGKSTLLSLVLADNPQVYGNDVRVAGQQLGPGRSIWDQKAWLGWLSPELETYTPADARAIEVVLSGFRSSLGVHGDSTLEQIQAATAWLEGLGLGSRRDALFAELSPIQRRLALLARAAVHGPSLLLLDEPCQGLDLAGRDCLLSAIAATASALTSAMVYVTHDLDEIPGSVTKILALRAGRVEYSGPIAAWRARL